MVQSMFAEKHSKRENLIERMTPFKQESRPTCDQILNEKIIGL
jgi:hypothetical protein